LTYQLGKGMGLHAPHHFCPMRLYSMHCHIQAFGNLHIRQAVS